MEFPFETHVLQVGKSKCILVPKEVMKWLNWKPKTQDEKGTVLTLYCLLEKGGKLVIYKENKRGKK